MTFARQRVLLVDDIAINRDIIGCFLTASGRVVITAGSGQEAVGLAAEQDFDLILMDVRMPVMDGLEATRRIRALPGRSGQTPILAQTVYDFSEQVAQFRNAGMNGGLTKPLDYATLIRAVDGLIGPGSAVN